MLLIANLRYVRRSARLQVDTSALQMSLTSQEQERQGREYLGNLLEIEPASLPPFGGWAASADFLIILAEHILMTKPAVVVEFGSGVSTLVALRCLQLNGTGKLRSFDHDPTFAKVTDGRAERLGFKHHVELADLRAVEGYQGKWYQTEISDPIDLMVVDGPPAAVHPCTRGGAGLLFRNIAPGGAILLDDASRAGELAIVQHWKRTNPDMSFSHIDTMKGTALGIKQR